MSNSWVVIEHPDGAISVVIDKPYIWDDPDRPVVRHMAIDGPYNPDLQRPDWSAGKIVFIPEAVEKDVLARLDRERDRRLQATMARAATRRVHEKKLREAESIGGDRPTPLLDGEAAALGLTREQVAAAVIARAAAEDAAQERIETTLRLAKENVRAAATGEGKYAAADAAWSELDD